MTTHAEYQKAQAEFWTGIAIVTVTAIMQGVVLFNNASFTLHSFGASFLVIYLTAATCYILLPWAEEFLEEHTRLARWALLGFCFWIGMEEMLHSAHAFQAPEGTAAVAATFSDIGKAKTIAATVAAFFALVVIETLWHFHHRGAKIVKRTLPVVRRHRALRRKHRQHA